MEKKDLIPWGDVVHHLKVAALYPQRRSEMIVRALQELLICLPSVATALIWPGQDRSAPWKVYYAGINQESMRRWLAVRLNFSLDATLGVLQEDLRHLSDMPIPQFVCLQPAPRFPAGLLIVWTTYSPLPEAVSDCLERVRQMLEALIEVESSEEYYFSHSSPLSNQAMIEALRQGDTHALSAFLGLTQLVGNAELTFWGRAYEDVVETRDHYGANHNDFGFVIPYGRGVGGRIAAYGTSIILVEDYRKSRYRDPSIADIIDAEGARSAIVLPVHSRTGQGKDVAGVLYAARRVVKPFSLAERLLVQRLACQLEPLRPLTRPFSFLSPGLPPVADQKPAWSKVVLHANPVFMKRI